MHMGTFTELSALPPEADFLTFTGLQAPLRRDPCRQPEWTGAPAAQWWGLCQQPDVGAHCTPLLGLTLLFPTPYTCVCRAPGWEPQEDPPQHWLSWPWLHPHSLCLQGRGWV